MLFVMLVAFADVQLGSLTFEFEPPILVDFTLAGPLTPGTAMFKVEEEGKEPYVHTMSVEDQGENFLVRFSQETPQAATLEVVISKEAASFTDYASAQVKLGNGATSVELSSRPIAYEASPPEQITTLLGDRPLEASRIPLTWPGDRQGQITVVEILPAIGVIDAVIWRQDRRITFSRIP